MVLPEECLRVLLRGMKTPGQDSVRVFFPRCQNPSWNARSVSSRPSDPYLTVPAQRRQQQINVKSHLHQEPRRSQVLNSDFRLS